jgi:chaperone required for assembly of F1-ATPase
MKRFYDTVKIGADLSILLDDKAVRTPARLPLVAPTKTLADLIAAEWARQGDRIDPKSMPMTRLANTAIDRAGSHFSEVALDVARYGETDLICYRAENPAALVARQAKAWDPLIAWMRARYDVNLTCVTGVQFHAQPDAIITRLRGVVHALDPWTLTGLHELVTLSGSLVIGLAVCDAAWSADAGWDAATVDERWQEEMWGHDTEAEKARMLRRAAFLEAAQFLYAVSHESA